jgi:hypothetical protein
MPAGLRALSRTELPLLPFGLVGIAALRKLFTETDSAAAQPAAPLDSASTPAAAPLAALVPELEVAGHGVIMTMGKGGVGKTSIAVNVAVELARRGHNVHLTTTDPAAHIEDTLAGSVDGIHVSRIDPAAETRAYSEEVLRTVGANLDAAGSTLLGWVINQSLTPLKVTDPILVRRRANEARFHAEVSALAARVAVVPWALPIEAQPRLDFFASADSPRAEAAP